MTSQAAPAFGVMWLANSIPQIALSFVGGAIADRVSRRTVIILGLLGFGSVNLSVGIMTAIGLITWQYLVVAAALQGSVMSLVMPSRQALVPELVGRDRLTNAVALNMVGMNVNRLGAPAIAGFIIAFWGIAYAYFLMAALCLVGAMLALPLPRGARLNTTKASLANTVADLRAGLQYVWQNQNIFAVLVVTLVTITLSMPYTSLLPVFVEDVYGLGPASLGLLISAGGIGALLGSLVVASIRDKKRGLLYLHSALLTGLALIAFSITSSYTTAMVIMGVVGIGQAGRMALGNILLQSNTEAQYMGRVMSLLMMEWGLTGLGNFGVAIAAEAIGVQWAIGITACLLVLVTVYYYAFVPRIRRMD